MSYYENTDKLDSYDVFFSQTYNLSTGSQIIEIDRPKYYPIGCLILLNLTNYGARIAVSANAFASDYAVYENTQKVLRYSYESTIAHVFSVLVDQKFFTNTISITRTYTDIRTYNLATRILSLNYSKMVTINITSKLYSYITSVGYIELFILISITIKI